ncbi:MAG: hypothetical protein R3B84_00675 [Zavarzinella sp.]
MGLSEKKSIINQVIDGQIKVWEAADRFRVAQSHTSACMERTTGVPNRVIDTELLCRTIIGWVDLALRDHPERAEFITSKLENELATYLHSGKSRRQADR